MNHRFQAVLVVTLFLGTPICAATKLDVTVIDRKDNSSNYTYVVPGYTTSTTTGNVDCTSYGNSANCYGETNSNGVSTPGFVGSYEVRGATLSLLLPDGRIAVVNCAAKVNWTEWANPNFYRSCRVPLVEHIVAEFDGDKARLKWPVSIDGKKMQTETYKILGVLDKPRQPPTQPEATAPPAK